MKKILVILAVFLVAALLFAQGQKETKKQTADDSKKSVQKQNEGVKTMPKKLVVYFSASGTTARVAKELAEAARVRIAGGNARGSCRCGGMDRAAGRGGRGLSLY